MNAIRKEIIISREEILGRLKASGLLFEILNLSGKEIIVHEATGHTGRKIGSMSYEIDADPSITPDVKNTLFTLYIPLVACSEGDVPQSPDEFFWMKNDDIETWLVAARKLNPKNFELLTLQEQQLDELMSEKNLAKKKRKRTK